MTAYHTQCDHTDPLYTSDRREKSYTQCALASPAIGDRILLPDSRTRHSGRTVPHVQGLIRAAVEAQHIGQMTCVR